MKIVRGGLIVMSWIAVFLLLTRLDWILEQPSGAVLILGIVAGFFLGVGILVSLITSAYSSTLSQEEDHRNHAVKVEQADFNPRGYKWS